MTHPRNETVGTDAPVLRRRSPFTHPIVLALGVVFALAAAAGALALTRSGVMPGVVVAGVDAGGMSQNELATELEPVIAAAEADPIQLHHLDTTLDVLPSDAGFTPTVEATVHTAWAHGRTGHVFERVWAHVAALWTTTEVAIQGELDQTALVAALDQAETAVGTPVFPGGITADPATLEVTTSAPERGFEVDRPALEADVRAAFGAPGVEQLEVPGSYVEPSTTMDDVEAVAEQARRALEAPFEATIAVIDEVVTLTPQELAPLLGAQLDDEGALVLSVDADLVSDAFGERVDLFDVAPRAASWDIPAEPITTLDVKSDVSWSPEPIDAPVIPSRPGRAFDGEAVATQMAAVLAVGDHDASFELPVVEPDFTTADAEAFGVTELLGTFTTYHAAGQPRVTNIHTLADVVDGTIVPPGEQFSINQLSDERTCEAGYVKDKMILNHKLVDVCGGGVSQFGTTMMNAAFFAGLPIDQYKAHSHYIDRYPMGREATLNYPSPDIDVRWTNDTGSGVLVRTHYTDTSITVSLYGTTDVTEVSARHSAPFRQRQAPTEYVEDKGLAPGQSRVVESGIAGFDIEVTRTIEREGGERVTDDFFTRYVTVPTIVHRNTSEPKPEPEPEPSPSPKQERADEEKDPEPSPKPKGEEASPKP